MSTEPTTSSGTRLGQVSVANAETDKQLAPVSPTGTPWIPPGFIPWLALVVAVAGSVLALPTMVAGLVLPPALVAICTLVVTLGTVLGIASPGARRPPG